MKYCNICKTKYEDAVSFCPTDGEVLEDDPSSIVNTVLDGQYQVESMLGKGGMGAVYSARHILLGDRVAIKILPPEVRTNAEWLRRFRREGQAARRFRHPNAVTVYDLRTATDGTVYMVMEYVEGRTLDAEIKRHGRFTPSEAFAILEPIMSVLNTAHSMGVVHRDLKPENIMIGKSGTGGEPVVKLLDLGIAKMREIAGVDGGGTTALTMAGQVLGTPYYMSPEQWGELPCDGNSEIDGRADIYSLGLVFYEMLVGKRPYSGVTLHELRREHISVTPRPLYEIVPGVQRAFSDVIARAISKDRGDRQSTAGELSAELLSALSTEVPAVQAGDTVVEASSAEGPVKTGGMSSTLDTKSDVNAPTVITLDEPYPTQLSTPGLATPLAQQPEVSRATPIPVDASSVAPPQGVNALVSADRSAEISSITIPQPPKPVAMPRPGKGKPMVFVGVGVLLCALLLLVIGGFFVLKWLSARSQNNSVTAGVNNNSSTGPSDPTVSESAAEVGRYWLELFPLSLGDEASRVAGVVPLASGQAFKFHFEFGEPGYLYIVGPGNQNRLTAFLTSKPALISGLRSNEVSKGGDFSFPSGVEHWLELDKKPGTEDYTVIFSSTALDSPAFFNAAVTGDPLTEAEQKALTDFLAKNKTAAPSTEVNDANGAEPFVSVKVPASRGGSPVVFGIRIQHK